MSNGSTIHPIFELLIAMVDFSKERMTIKWKTEYLKAIVRQDVGWYDTNNPTELSSKIGESIKLIEEGLSSKALILFEWLGMGASGLVLCFYWNWTVGLVVLACSPLVALGGGLMACTPQPALTPSRLRTRDC